MFSLVPNVLRFHWYFLELLNVEHVSVVTEACWFTLGALIPDYRVVPESLCSHCQHEGYTKSKATVVNASINLTLPFFFLVLPPPVCSWPNVYPAQQSLIKKTCSFSSASVGCSLKLERSECVSTVGFV